MSRKIDTNGSRCFNTAAGCISRQQLVQFRNRMGPRAQWGPRCTVWQHKCHNSFFLTPRYFIWGQQFVPVRQHKIEGELIFWQQRQAAEQRTFHARLLNGENLIIRTGAVEKPASATALSKTLNILLDIKWAQHSVQSHWRWCSHSVSYHCIGKKKQMVNTATSLFFQISIVTLLSTSNVSRTWQWITCSHFRHVGLVMFGVWHFVAYYNFGTN